VDAQCAASAFHQHLQIPASLRRFHDAEGARLAGHWNVRGVVRCDLEERASAASARNRIQRGHLSLNDIQPLGFIAAGPQCGVALPQAPHFRARTPAF
jgi:hypothetical protein